MKNYILQNIYLYFRKEALVLLTIFGLTLGHEFVIRRERRDVSEEVSV